MEVEQDGLLAPVIGERYVPAQRVGECEGGGLIADCQTGLTWGNLSSHTSKLEEAGYIEVEKEFKGKKPNTMLRLTEAGREAFREYRHNMKQVLDELPD